MAWSGVGRLNWKEADETHSTLVHRSEIGAHNKSIAIIGTDKMKAIIRVKLTWRVAELGREGGGETGTGDVISTSD